MPAKVLSSAVLGINAYIVEVEVHITRSQLPKYVTVGLPEGAVKESKERVRAAIQNSGFTFPPHHITVNLAPADIRKEGSAFDMPIAIGILAELGHIDPTYLKNIVLLGELALDGSLRPIKGALPISLAIKEAKIHGILLPEGNANEAGVVNGIKVVGVNHLKDVIQILNKELHPQPVEIDRSTLFKQVKQYSVDLSGCKRTGAGKKSIGGCSGRQS